jgi:hypothetical protein
MHSWPPPCLQSHQVPAYVLLPRMLTTVRPGPMEAESSPLCAEWRRLTVIQSRDVPECRVPRVASTRCRPSPSYRQKDRGAVPVGVIAENDADPSLASNSPAVSYGRLKAGRRGGVRRARGRDAADVTMYSSFGPQAPLAVKKIAAPFPFERLFGNLTERRSFSPAPCLTTAAILLREVHDGPEKFSPRGSIVSRPRRRPITPKTEFCRRRDQPWKGCG